MNQTVSCVRTVQIKHLTHKIDVLALWQDHDLGFDARVTRRRKYCHPCRTEDPSIAATLAAWHVKRPTSKLGVPRPVCKTVDKTTKGYFWIILQVCRVCLISNVDLYEMNYSLFQDYEQLSAREADCVESLPKRVCRDCFFRLLSAVNFKNTALQSHALLHNTFNLILSPLRLVWPGNLNDNS